MIYKRCSHCGKRIPEGTTCPCVIAMKQAMNKARHKAYDAQKRDKQSQAFYNSCEWHKAHDMALQLDEGIDVYAYMTTGELIPADTVHHIVPLRDDPARRCDLNNLMSLSHGSHSYIESQYKVNKKSMQVSLSDMLARYRRRGRG